MVRQQSSSLSGLFESKFVPEGNERFWVQNKWTSSWGSGSSTPTQLLRVKLASKNTWRFRVCCTCCWSRIAHIMKRYCSYCHTMQSHFFIAVQNLCVWKCNSMISKDFARTCYRAYDTKQLSSLGSIFWCWFLGPNIFSCFNFFFFCRTYLEYANFLLFLAINVLMQDM